MRSFIAILAAAATLQGSSAAPFANEHQPATTITIKHTRFPHPSGGFPHPTGGFPHPTGGPRRPDGHGMWVRDADHTHPEGRPHPTGHHGDAHPTGGPHPQKERREDGKKPWGHGTGGFPHPTGGRPHPTGHHGHGNDHEKRYPEPEHHRPSGVPHPSGHHHPPPPTGGFAHPTGSPGHHHNGNGQGKHSTTTTTQVAQPTGENNEKRAEENPGPFAWPHPSGGFPHSISISLPTFPHPTGFHRPHPTGHPRSEDKERRSDNEPLREREVLQEMPRVVQEAS
ncbi:hypothetical protein F4677DRAFT_27948 [Hypoxylon crocopeplum]|nr:hypothetical protein F4677DRAFT_27948 [Hypoxylon crocopeplum]